MKELACPKCGCAEIEPNHRLYFDASGDAIGEHFFPECKKCGSPFSEAAWRGEKVIFT